MTIMMTSSRYTLQQRVDIVQDSKNKDITLDGKPAMVTGFNFEAAIIRQAGTRNYIEVNWDEVRKIIDGDGIFLS